jgi:hypothetical protein
MPFSFFAPGSETRAGLSLALGFGHVVRCILYQFFYHAAADPAGVASREVAIVASFQADTDLAGYRVLHSAKFPVASRHVIHLLMLLFSRFSCKKCMKLLKRLQIACFKKILSSVLTKYHIFE